MGRRFLIFTILCFSLSFSALYGAPAVVKDIVFDGVHAFSPSKLKKLILTKKKKWYSGIFSEPPMFRESLLKADLRRIESFYFSQGYPRVEVKADVQRLEGNQVKIFIRVREGNRYEIVKVGFSGNQVVSSEELSKAVAVRIGKPFNFNSIPNLIDNIKEVYGNIGYPYVSVESSYALDDSSCTVELLFKINEGKLTYFGDSIIRGLGITDSLVVLREIKYKKGDVYSSKRLLLTKKRLINLDLFDMVTITPDFSESEPDTIPVRLNLVEKKSWFVGTNFSLATNPNYDLTMDIIGELGNRNIVGSGRKASLKAVSQFELVTRYRNLKNILALEYGEPYPFGLSLPLKIELYFDPGNRSESEQYRVQKLGTKLHSVYNATEITSHQFSFSYERVDIFGVKTPQLVEQIKLEKGIRIKRVFGYVYSRDSRDNVFIPTRGSNTFVNCEYAGFGGDDNYLLLRFSWSRYIAIRDGLIYTNRLLLGGIGNLMKDEDILPHNRLFLGGGTTIRGFPEKGLGPKDLQGAPLGGKALFLSNFELRAHIKGKVWLTGFVDIGNLWGSIEQVTPSQLRVTSGWGIALMTPFGPLRFDYAYHLRKLDPDVRSRWHLGIFYAF